MGDLEPAGAGDGLVEGPVAVPVDAVGEPGGLVDRRGVGGAEREEAYWPRTPPAGPSRLAAGGRLATAIVNVSKADWPGDPLSVTGTVTLKDEVEVPSGGVQVKGPPVVGLIPAPAGAPGSRLKP